jgi:hypothetical protein
MMAVIVIDFIFVISRSYFTVIKTLVFIKLVAFFIVSIANLILDNGVMVYNLQNHIFKIALLLVGCEK